MTVQRTIKRVGGSLAVIIPRDIAEAMRVTEESPVRVTLVGRQLVVEPSDDYMTDAEFQRAFAAVLRRDTKIFQDLADYDAGRAPFKQR